MPVVTGLSLAERELLVTSLHDALPEMRYHIAGDSIWPLLLAVAVAGSLIGFIFHPWAVPVGAAVIGLALIGWFWPTTEPQPIHDPSEATTPAAADDGHCANGAAS